MPTAIKSTLKGGAQPQNPVRDPASGFQIN